MIDRIIPRYFASDADERLTQEGAMIHAKNVSVSSMGEGTEMILKNVRGTTEIPPEAPIPSDSNVKIIGSIEDDKNSMIYFFVADEDDAGAEHAIYRYSKSSGTYEVILQNANLNFDHNSWVKGDIIHGTFGRSNTEATILYFTDDVNPPRKVNVTRALNGEYNIAGARAFDLQISNIRAASTVQPTVSPSTDTSRNINAIDGNFFQFATQILYDDGEESAISPYSDIFLCRPTYLNALTATSGENFSVDRLVDNVILVGHNVDLNIPGIHKINILCRNGIDSTWFVADSFNPYENVIRNIDSQPTNVFVAGSNTYRFYNDTIGSLIAPSVSNKNYDNVPLLARGQSIVKNRLFYSNYTEGYENTNVGNVVATAKYSDDTSGATQYYPPPSEEADCWTSVATLTNVGGTHATFDVLINLVNCDFSTATDPVPAGTKFDIDFDWAPSVTLAGVDIDADAEYGFNLSFPVNHSRLDDTESYYENLGQIGTVDMLLGDSSTPLVLYYLDVSNVSDTTESAPYSEVAGSARALPKENNVSRVISVSYTQSNDGDLTDVADGIYDILLEAKEAESLKVSYSYLLPLTINGSYEEQAAGITYPNDSLIQYRIEIGTRYRDELIQRNRDWKIKITWDFNVSLDGATITLEPYIDDIELLGYAPESMPWNPVITGPITSAFDNTLKAQYSGSSLTSFSATGYLAGLEASFAEGINPVSMDPGVTNGDYISLGIPTLTINESETLSITGDNYAIDNRAISAISTGLVPTFKAGSTHSFGIVYYDKFGRHGFVNPLGSLYAKYTNERGSFTSDGDGYYMSDGTVGQGPVSASFQFSERGAAPDFEITNYVTPPAWAERWHIVYAGSNLNSSFTQYEVGNAYPRLKVWKETDGTLAKEIDRESMQLYVRIDGLTKYSTDRGVNKSYSYTVGDKLRVVKYKPTDNVAGTEDFRFPTANDGSMIEFDVVGYAVLDGNDLENPIDPAVVEADIDQTGKYHGEFVIIESAQINTGLQLTGTTTPLKYVGFDWQHVATTVNGAAGVYNYMMESGLPGDPDHATQVNHWGKRTIVDIVTPKKNTSQKIYYEIATSGIIDRTPGNPNHGRLFITTSNGDAWYRPAALFGPKGKFDAVDDSFIDWSYRDLFNEQWGYTTQVIEDSSITDKATAASWNRGRAHAIYEKAKQVRRYNSITWSDAYNEDVENLKLSTFNAASVNYVNLSNKYGAINFIGNYDDLLFAGQENKISLTPVQRSVLNQAAGGDGVVSLSNSVLNDANTNYMAGDWGVGNNPESVLIYDTQIFFADASRGKIVRMTREGLSPISDKGLSEAIDNAFSDYRSSNNPFKRVISGFDPQDSTYYFTIRGKNDKTFGYDVKRGVWQAQYTFLPDLYSRQNNDFFSFLQAGDGTQMMWIHDNEAIKNYFYGTSNHPSEITVISKYNPSMVKIYKAIGLNATRAFDTSITSSAGNRTGDAPMTAGSYVERENHYYREIPGDISTTDSQNTFGLGTATAGGGSATITMNSKLRGMQVPIGGSLYYYSDGIQGLASAGTGVEAPTIVSVDVENNTITLSGSFDANRIGEDLFVVTNASANGARIRGHYAKIELSFTTNTPWELYSIDLNFENSRPNYALGQ